MGSADYRLEEPGRIGDVALGQLVLAREALAASRVHDLRKAAKRLRALLRLVRASTGKKRAGKDDRIIRDLARAVGDARDAEVMAALFDDLVPRLEAPALEIENMQAHLQRRIRRSRQDRDDTAIEKRLDRVERRIRKWTATTASVDEGVERTLRRCRSRMETAEASQSAEDLHDWRKEAKYHWHHCDLIGAEPRAKQVHALSDALGDDHDLVVLLAQGPDLAGLADAVALRRRALQERAFELGHELFGTGVVVRRSPR